MTNADSLPVQIGEVKVGRAGQSLNAILGSCIGIGFLDKKNGVYGLAHALLAKSNGPSIKGGGRHVDVAIETLLRKMEVADEERRKLGVFIAGGANMTLPIGTDAKRLVGAQNADFARSALRDAGLRISCDDTGGEHGRRVTIDCNSGEFTISSIPRLGDT
ncbi:MAG: chemotaxis protein CheD [Pseudomonadota bacterium]